MMMMIVLQAILVNRSITYVIQWMLILINLSAYMINIHVCILIIFNVFSGH